ncbi:hypothetical protein GV794_02100 [Nocardia cyriacigeorgica]|uniref:Uncharacterized protein n=1 Tax=Nocardia cyriacigeorgica TaxID=135487 RepID=A0ABX0CEI7_9NOCA|nr:hypothetical protein [Nocardia cyriacigeorgica]NEW42753.1 hypothetical protein [Nocardia cyriacigeorgica]NEW53952.1 hypothetical protein [Nocardia cyriacigeorgica]NEW54459.1 hypothetical protein [Nocardia cyriacigeorgica]
MSPDRYGEPTERGCRNPQCRRGWLGNDNDGRPIPCLGCKPHLAQTKTINDHSERPPSARAQQAIESEAL